MSKNSMLKNASLGLLSTGHLGINAWRQLLAGNDPGPIQLKKSTKSKKKRLLIIGWDAADWKIINPLIDKGMMPTLQKLINEGTIGNLRTLDPPYSPMLWTSIATGKRPDKHGILGFIEPHPDTGDIRPVQSSSRKCRAFWNILSHLDYKVNMVGWWPTHPVEPINGAMVSNQFPKAAPQDSDTWALQNGSVHPTNFTEALSNLRIHPNELTENEILPFIPNAAHIDQKEDQSLAHLSKHLAEAISLQAATTYLMSQSDWDVTAVYFDAIDKICHRFAKYLPPRMQAIPEEKYHMYKKVVPGMYRFHDMMLDQLIQQAGEDTTVLLLSDHGFYTGPSLLAKKPKVSAAIAMDHRPQGIFCLKGPSIKKDELVHGASLLDITPTLLALLGEPIGEDMDGKVLQQCFEKPLDLKQIPSWESKEGDFGEHPEHLKEDPTYTKAALQQLVDLGYVEALGDEAQERLNKVSRDNQINLALSYADNKRLLPAIEILEKCYLEDKVDRTINLNLIEWYCQTNRPEKARAILSAFKKFNMDRTIDFDLLEINILFRENNYEKIISLCDKFLQNQPNHSGVMAHRALALRKSDAYADAGKIYQTLLAHQPENDKHWLNLGICQIKQDQNERAVDSILKSIGLNFNQPTAHYQLGKVLIRMELFEEAVNALETCLKLHPRFNRARNQLVNIYTDKLKDAEKAQYHRDQYYQTNPDEMVMVSGLPRSGTSMMMQMLKAGGMPILTDNVRLADQNNAQGYYEYEPVKNSLKDKSWLEKATGKAVKVVVPLIAQFHVQTRCKVILMERPIKDIMYSQQKMIARLYPNRNAETFNPGLAKKFESAVESTKVKLKSRAAYDLMSLNYIDVVENPETAAKVIADFLGYPLDQKAMAQVVNKSLHHEKNN